MLYVVLVPIRCSNLRHTLPRSVLIWQYMLSASQMHTPYQSPVSSFDTVEWYLVKLNPKS